MSRLGIIGAAAAGILVALLAVYASVVKDQRDVARGEAATMRERVTAAERALADERASTAEALGAAQRCAAEQADGATRCRAATDGLNFQLQHYRAQLDGCLDPKVLIDRGGRLFPGPVQPDAPAPAVPR